jgi:hypothetical protein
MRLRTGAGIMAGASGAAVLLFSAVNAQTPTATPTPAPEGVISAIVHSTANTAAWLTDLAVEYAGSPLWTTIAGIAIIVLIVSLIMWMRRPRKPLETKVPL